jgi:anthranilate synthase/aminodeoxychorismate synthase-like glutamine amidotransferase
LFAGAGAEVRVVRADADAAELLAMRPDQIVISPGPGHPRDAGASIPLVRGAAELGIPLLGICLGMQAIAVAFGGTVERTERALVHGEASDVAHDGLGVLTDMPNPFAAGRYHSLAVDRATLPAELEQTARAADGTLMALRHRELPIEGVQFHPESILTPDGARIAERFLTTTEVYA